MAAWRWDRVHQARSEHRPFSTVPALARGFELRAPVGGDTYTVNVSRVNLKPDLTTGELYLDEHGPSMRAIYDLGDLANSRFMHSTGQSGIPPSPSSTSSRQRSASVLPTREGVSTGSGVSGTWRMLHGSPRGRPRSERHFGRRRTSIPCLRTSRPSA